MEISSARSTGRRRFMPTLLAFATLAALALLTTQAQAACKEGFCVSGTDENGLHKVTFTTTWTKVSHFNWSNDFNHQQLELGPNDRYFDFYEGPPGTVVNFQIQACSGGEGVFHKSTCTPWASFSHTVQ